MLSTVPGSRGKLCAKTHVGPVLTAFFIIWCYLSKCTYLHSDFLSVFTRRLVPRGEGPHWSHSILPLGLNKTWHVVGVVSTQNLFNKKVNSEQSFLTSAPVTFGAGSFCVGGCAVHCMVFSSTPGLHPLDARATSHTPSPTCWCDNQQLLQTLPNVAGGPRVLLWCVKMIPQMTCIHLRFRS